MDDVTCNVLPGSTLAWAAAAPPPPPSSAASTTVCVGALCSLAAHPPCAPGAAPPGGAPAEGQGLTLVPNSAKLELFCPSRNPTQLMNVCWSCSS